MVAAPLGFSPESLAKLAELETALGSAIRGKSEVVRLSLVCLLARGHLLIEDVPGVGKTTLAQALARSVACRFHRLQFTSDMLPSDVLGVTIYNAHAEAFEFKPGPIFSNFLLADEINRTTPKTQSALLEAMNESQVTIDGRSHSLPRPFMVIATQNPMEFEGVYPLPEGQLDRFMVKVSFDYPSREVEANILKRNLSSMDLNDVRTVVTAAELDAVVREVDHVTVSDDILAYLARMAEATRNEGSLVLGASPRAMVQLLHCARAKALLDGRRYVTPNDIKTIASEVLTHRLTVDRAAALKGVSRNPEAILTAILDKVEPPR
jgi:MoxR-like ATPase